MQPIKFTVELTKDEDGNWILSIPDQLLDMDDKLLEPWQDFVNEIGEIL